MSLGFACYFYCDNFAHFLRSILIWVNNIRWDSYVKNANIHSGDKNIESRYQNKKDS